MQNNNSNFIMPQTDSKFDQEDNKKYQQMKLNTDQSYTDLDKKNKDLKDKDSFYDKSKLDMAMSLDNA